MAELRQPNSSPFATKPKTRRHLTRGAFISGTRAVQFMEHLWDTGLKKSCAYEVLKWEFIRHFETNDARIVERYIGAPEQTIRSKGSSTVRINRTSGKVAVFDYINERKTCRKQGLLETLGYLTLKQEIGNIDQGAYRLAHRTGNWIAVLHHERMNYSSEQTILETAISPQESEESSEFSKDEMCVSSISGKEDRQTPLQGKECEKTVLQLVSQSSEGATARDNGDGGEREEIIDSAHANQSSESEAGKEVQTRTEHTSGGSIT